MEMIIQAPQQPTKRVDEPHLRVFVSLICRVRIKLKALQTPPKHPASPTTVAKLKYKHIYISGSRNEKTLFSRCGSKGPLVF